jgi:pyruvate/2-oxoglutarate dehydrogenase complex dihydrolipoamide dehydrogenase (E3) component
MLKRKDTVVKQNNDGILFLFKKNKVTFFHGRAAFAGPPPLKLSADRVGAGQRNHRRQAGHHRHRLQRALPGAGSTKN